MAEGDPVGAVYRGRIDNIFSSLRYYDKKNLRDNSVDLQSVIGRI